MVRGKSCLWVLRLRLQLTTMDDSPADAHFWITANLPVLINYLNIGQPLAAITSKRLQPVTFSFSSVFRLSPSREITSCSSTQSTVDSLRPLCRVDSLEQLSRQSLGRICFLWDSQGRNVRSCIGVLDAPTVSWRWLGVEMYGNRRHVRELWLVHWRSICSSWSTSPRTRRGCWRSKCEDARWLDLVAVRYKAGIRFFTQDDAVPWAYQCIRPGHPGV